MIMKKIYWVFLLVIGLSTFTGCSVGDNKHALIDEFDIPDRAQNVKKLSLGTEDSQQIYYEITESYPGVSQLDKYKDYLRKNGWFNCTSNISGWSSYEDRSSKMPLMVFQLIDYWIKRDSGKLLSLSGMYHSKNIAKNVPDTDTQKIIILVQKSKQLDKYLEELKLDCSIQDR